MTCSAWSGSRARSAATSSACSFQVSSRRGARGWPEQSRPVHLSLQLADEGLEPEVPNALDDDAMELGVRVERFSGRSRALAGGLDLDEPIEHGQLGVVDGLGRDAGGHALERGPDLVDLQDVVDPQLGDEASALGDDGDQPLGGQQPERLAHRRPAQAEPGGHVGLGDPLQGTEGSRQDGLLDALVGGGPAPRPALRAAEALSEAVARRASHGRAPHSSRSQSERRSAMSPRGQGRGRPSSSSCPPLATRRPRWNTCST